MSLTRALLLLFAALRSVNSVQLNLEKTLSDFVSTLEQYATQKNDVVFVLDESGSIEAENFPHEIEMMEMIARLLTVSPDFSRIAVMTFSNGYVEHVNYVANSLGGSMCSLLYNIHQIPYRGGGTATSVALWHADDILRNSRPGSNRIVILISDGQANAGYNPLNAAYHLKQKGVIIFAVGVASINAAELHGVATSSEHVYMLTNFPLIKEINQKLRDDVKDTHFDVSTSRSCDRIGCDVNAVCACGARGGSYQCVCKEGYWGKGVTGQCYPTPRGTYKDTVGEYYKRCPENSTTAGEGATSVSGCFCVEGYEGDPETSRPCEPVKCAGLTPPQNGATIPPSCGNTFGASCDFMCYEGHCPYSCDPNALAAGKKPWNKMTGRARVCKADKLWSSVEFKCEKVRCPALKNPQNGVIDCTNPSFEYEAECTVICNVGYERIGDDVVVCKSNGQWTGSLPTCKAITCPPLKSKGKLKLRPTSCKNVSEFGKVCTYSCKDESFALINKNTRKASDGILTCLAEGEWSDNINNLGCKDIQKPNITSCPGNIEESTRPNVEYSVMLNWSVPIAKDNVQVLDVVIIEPLWLTVLRGEKPTAPPAEFRLGETRVKYVAEDTSGLMSDPCEFTVTIVDNDPPKVKYCPDNIIVQHHKRSKEVHWEEPKFVDNAGAEGLTITSSRNPGTQFTWGPESVVQYTATDRADNRETCIFTVVIQPYPCKYYPPPKNGYVSCDSEFQRQACAVYCHEGYSFSFSPEPLYRCKQTARGGNWTTAVTKRRGTVKMPWPDCAVSQQAKKSSVQVVSSVATVSCNIAKEKLNAIKQQFIDNLKQTTTGKVLCGHPDACTVEKIHIDCNNVTSTTPQGTRARRGIRLFLGEAPHRILKRAVDILETVSEKEKKDPLDTRLVAELTITFSVDLPADLDTKSLVKDCEICKNSTLTHPSNAETVAVVHALQSTVSEVVDAAIRDELPDAVVVGTEGTVESECGEGQVSNGLMCVNCPIGTYYMNSTTCLPCPIGSYADHEASISCTPCSGSKTTLSEKSSSPSDCKDLCSPGYYSTTGREPCVVCPEGEYQEDSGQTQCAKCAEGLTTASWASTSEKNCSGACSPGTFSLSGLLPCSRCPRGTYQQKEGGTECVRCPEGKSTNASASTAESDCFVLNLCQKLQPCAEGATCIDTTHSYTCECPDGLEGADCSVNINDCEPDQCLNGGRCIDGVDNVTCECERGFTGLSCETNIDDCASSPCLHGGTCVDGISSFACKCSQGFTGKHCERMFRHCVDEPCQNGGTCFESATGFRCCCPEEFMGRTCELRYEPCLDQPCQNGGLCEPDEHSPHRYHCLCAYGYTGDKCETNVDDCTSDPCFNGGTCVDGEASYTCQCPDLYEGPSCETVVTPQPYSLSFPNGYVSDYARINIDRNLRALTLSFFMKTSQQDKRGTAVSYAFRHPGLNAVLDNAFALTDPNRMLLYFYQNSTDTGIAANDDLWHHCALTWSSENGVWMFYWDGELKATDTSVTSKGSYMFRGELVIGQDQDSVGGGFSGLESFAGEIAELNVWDYSISKDDIQKLRSSCGLIGNVVAWYKLRNNTDGNVEISEVTPDFCPGYNCSSSSCHCSTHPAAERIMCDKAVDVCSSNPCKNGQICAELSDDKGICMCDGYEGRRCEFDIDECVTEEHQCSHICINTLGSYECSCPQGMALNFDNKTCVDASFCIQGDSAYMDGDAWSQDCQQCTCAKGFITCSSTPCADVTCPQGQMIVHNPGDCCPSCAAEPLKCSLYSNGTLVTFDQMTVPLLGHKVYTLFQDCVNGDFTGNIDAGSSQKSIRFYIHCLSVTLYDNRTVVVNTNVVTLPYEETGIVKIIEIQDQSVQVQTHHGVVLQLRPDRSFLVSAPQKLFMHMCGLCGNMNGITSDDLQTRHHIPAKTVDEYVNSWKEYKVYKGGIPESCVRVPRRQKDRADKICKILQGRIFDVCYKQVKRPYDFVTSCMDAMCTCNANQLCFCDAFLGFRLACDKNNVTVDYLPERLQKLLLLCESRCPAGMIFMTCGPLHRRQDRHCPRTDIPVYGILRTTRCLPGCFCPEGKVFRRGRCVGLSLCDKRA